METFFYLVISIGLIVVIAKLYVNLQNNQDNSIIRSLAPSQARGHKRRIFTRGNLRPRKVSLETLKSLIPIRSIDDHVLALIHKQSEPIKAGCMLFEEGNSDDSILFLLDGIVSIRFKGVDSYQVESGSAIARFPLSVGPQHKYTAISKTDVHVLRVPNKLTAMSTSDEPGYNNAKDIVQLNIPGELKLSGLVHSFGQHILNEELQLPSFPDIALKLRKAIQKDVSVAEAVKIIQMDPTIAAKLIQVANSPFYIAENPASRCQDAVSRIGLIATREIVTSISLHQVFQARHPRIKAYLTSLWRSSIGLSSLCYVLADKSRRIDPDLALLAGLVCDIGIVPFLTFAENFPDELFESEELDQAIPYLRGPIGSLVLRRWEFSDEIVQIPSIAEDWFYDSGSDLTIGDIVILAKLHNYIGTKKQAELPPINAIPAYAKLDNVGLSPEMSLDLLHDAQALVGSVKCFF